MHFLCDSPSIRAAVTNFPELSDLLTRRLEELAQYDDYELHELVNILIAEPGDRLADLSAAVGFALEARHPDAVETHPAWYELTYVLSDDGFGVVVYVPKAGGMDPAVLSLCSSLAGDGSP